MELSVAVAVTCSSHQDGPRILTLIITDTQSLPFHWQIQLCGKRIFVGSLF